MPADPNARLIKAVEDLTREVKENNRQLKKIIRNSHVSPANHAYLEMTNENREGSDDSADSEASDPGTSDN